MANCEKVPGARQIKMEPEKVIQKTTQIIEGAFDLPITTTAINEEDLVQALAQKIADMLEHEPEQLMSALYRLDVLEEKIHPVMRPDAEEPANVALARLVIERQKQRVLTKATIQVKPIEGMDGWEW